MKICFPVEKNNGLESSVYGHFGSAPVFVIYDTETRNVTAINNKSQHHTHGACNPLQSLSGSNIDAIVVGGIGAGALNKLKESGIKAYRATGATIKENIPFIESSSLSEITLMNACGGHQNGSGCSHS